MTTAPDADELAVKARLKELIDGPVPSAQPDAVDTAAAAAIAQPAPESAAEPVSDADAQPDAPRRIRNRIPDWRTGRHVDLTPEPDADAQPDQDVQPDADDEPEDAEEGEPDADAQPKKRRPRLRIPTAPRILSRGTPAGYEAVIAAPAPKLSLLEAAQNVAPRVRWLVLHGSAAAVGYHFGWVQYFTRYADWLSHHPWSDLTGGFWVGCAVGAELLRRYGRSKAFVIRWAFAIPVSSLVVGTLLYGTGWQNLELPL